MELADGKPGNASGYSQILSVNQSNTKMNPEFYGKTLVFLPTRSGLGHRGIYR